MSRCSRGWEPARVRRRSSGALSEDLLARFVDLPLLDGYDVYQRLMDYWDETMQDDVYLVASEGWLEAARPRGIVEDRGRKLKETPDLVVGRRKYKTDLIPPALIVARYFGMEQAVVDELRRRQETAARELEEFLDEHTGERALLEGILNDRGKVTRGDRASAGSMPSGMMTTRKAKRSGSALERCLALVEGESALAKTIRTVQARLDEQVLDHYAALTEAEIRSLGGRGQVARQPAGRRRGRDGAGHPAARREGEGAGGALRPPPPEARAGRGGLQREGRGAPQANGALPVTRHPALERTRRWLLRDVGAEHLQDSDASAVRSEDKTLTGE